MREAFDDLLRDRWLISVAFGVAVGWAILRVAEGASTVLSTLSVDYSTLTARDIANTSWLTFDVGGRVLALDELVWSLVEFGIVLLLALLVLRRRGRLPEPR